MCFISFFIVFVCSFAFAENSFFSSANLAPTTGINQRSQVVLTPTHAEEPVDSNYILGPGDFLDLMLEDKYLSVQIYPDGSIAIEECGAVNVGGKPLHEAKNMILDLVAKRYKRELCFVQLAVLKKFRVNAMGALHNVGQHFVDPQTRLSLFIRNIGGLLPNANSEDILVIRGQDTVHVNFGEMAQKGIFENDLMLEQGDKIYVPFVGLGENVVFLFPGYRTSVAYEKGRKLQEYFDLAGGSKLHNFGYKAVCIREPGKPARWITLSEMKVTEVVPNTEVEFSIQQMPVYVGGSVARLGQVEYNASWHAIDYIAAAGLTPISGTWSQVRVWRGKNPEALNISITEDPIMPGDYIELPKSRYESFKDFTLFLASLLTVVSSAFIIYGNFK